MPKNRIQEASRKYQEAYKKSIKWLLWQTQMTPRLYSATSLYTGVEKYREPQFTGQFAADHFEVY